MGSIARRASGAFRAMRSFNMGYPREGRIGSEKRRSLLERFRRFPNTCRHLSTIRAQRVLWRRNANWRAAVQRQLP